MGYMTSRYRTPEPARLVQREAACHPVLLQRATLSKSGKEADEARLLELSVYGCRLSIDGRYKPGDRLWLRFAGANPIAGTAIWYEAGKLGCRFDEVIDRMLCRALTLAR